MIRGTTYAALEIIAWMVLAGAIGLLTGWLVGRWTRRRKLNASWQERLAAAGTTKKELEEELAETRASAEGLAADLDMLRSRIEELEAAADAPLAESTAAEATMPDGADENAARPDAGDPTPSHQITLPLTPAEDPPGASEPGSTSTE